MHGTTCLSRQASSNSDIDLEFQIVELFSHGLNKVDLKNVARYKYELQVVQSASLSRFCLTPSSLWVPSASLQCFS